MLTLRFWASHEIIGASPTLPTPQNPLPCFVCRGSKRKAVQQLAPKPPKPQVHAGVVPPGAGTGVPGGQMQDQQQWSPREGAAEEGGEGDAYEDAADEGEEEGGKDEGQGPAEDADEGEEEEEGEGEEEEGEEEEGDGGDDAMEEDQGRV